MAQEPEPRPLTRLGPYVLYDEIAFGRIGTVHLARSRAELGHSRVVAVKKLHRGFRCDGPEQALFLDEARLGGLVRHPNVVSALDLRHDDDELFFVMEYVAGESLAALTHTSRERTPPAIVSAVMHSVLEGLHAVHRAADERGELVGLVHRDVSPYNIHVGLDGVARILDFREARATARPKAPTHLEGRLPDIRFMAPEILEGGPLDLRADVHGAAATLWQVLTGTRIYDAESTIQTVERKLTGTIAPPSSIVADLPVAIDAVVLKGLERAPADRWSSAREMAVALEAVLPPASPREVSEWVRETAGERLARRLELVRLLEAERYEPDE